MHEHKKARSRIYLKRIQRKRRVLLASAFVLAILTALYISSKIESLSPVGAVSAPTHEVVEVEKIVIKEQPRENVDTYIGDAVDEFVPNHRSEARMIMHCLAHRENGHGGNPDAHGDNGLAGGPFQFHQATWERMRKAMIKQGHATEIGSRYDFKEASRTTAWAMLETEKPRNKRSGSIFEWGPVLRDSNGDNYASCQTPSWLVNNK